MITSLGLLLCAFQVENGLVCEVVGRVLCVELMGLHDQRLVREVVRDLGQHAVQHAHVTLRGQDLHLPVLNNLDGKISKLYRT